MNTNTKHTPGPWQVSSMLDGTYITGGPVVLNGRLVLAKTMVTRDGGEEERKANAFLISAAPELKDELWAYHQRYWSHQNHEGIPAHDCGELPDQCGGCAAYAKAEGRS